jgi:arylsulfatase A-like enzyme
MRAQLHQFRPQILLFIVVVSGGWLLSCGAGQETAEPTAPAAEARPNLLLISVDTLRADALSSYGAARQTTPFLDSLAAEGVRFEHAYATASWTTPSVVSMLTSSYPNRHRMGGRLRGIPRAWSTIPETLPNLASRLGELGYRTYGLVANTNLAPERGFDRGFDRFLCLGTADLDEVDQAFEPWIEEIVGGEGPWFVWLHLLDPHGPYNGRQPWIDEYGDDHERFGFLDGMRSELLSQKAPKLLDVHMEYVRALYDSEVAATADYLKSVFERLPGSEDAFVLFTADHGEEFLDHGGMQHGRTLYDESTRIPMILRTPDREPAGVVAEGAVSLVDVLPTLLAAAGDKPIENAVGENLLTQLGDSASNARIVVAELLRGSVDRAVMDGRYKLILTERKGQTTAELFDLQNDPGEQHNLVTDEAERVARLTAWIEAFAATHLPLAESGESAITPEQLEALRSLGYVGE